MLSIASIHHHEIEKIKGSRFIAYAFPVQSVQDFQTCLATVQKAYSSARHYCWAYQGRDQDDVRYSDDGEPSGTAGKPILQVLQGMKLTQVLVIVVRYFGGVKLGTGGLARAYALATKEVLQQCQCIELKLHVTISLEITYSFEASFQHLLKQFEAQCIEIDYSDQVYIQLKILASQAPILMDQVTQKTAAQAHMECSDPYWAV